MGTVLILAVLALAGFGIWRWAEAQGSAATLDWIDARFSRDQAVRLAEESRYGTQANQNVELWVPEGPAPAEGWPLAVFLYGGGWHSGETASYRFVARTLGDRGYATALVGYRLVDSGGRFPVMLEDTAAGVRKALDRGGSVGIDTGQTVLIGHSAGAYNVLMMGLDPQWLEGAGVPQERIAGIVSLAGPADFYPFTSDSARNALGNAPDPLLTQPIHFARADAPQILVMHGTADDVVRVRNSRNLARAIRDRGGAVDEQEFDGMGHAGIVMGLSKPFAQGGKVIDPLVSFMERAFAQAAADRAKASVPVQGESG